MFLLWNVPSKPTTNLLVREGGSVPEIISAVGLLVGSDTGHAGQTFLDGVTTFCKIMNITCESRLLIIFVRNFDFVAPSVCIALPMRTAASPWHVATTLPGWGERGWGNGRSADDTTPRNVNNTIITHLVYPEELTWCSGAILRK